jgi:hypothetical protein
MTYIGSLLELDEGSRLTSIGLRPLAQEEISRDGAVSMHIVVLPDGDDPAAASGAVSTFMPASLAVIDGNQPDGSTWFAIFQLAADQHDLTRVTQTADASMIRALELTGLIDHDLWGLTIPADDLRAEYDDLGDVTSWSITDLLTGLIIELATQDLSAVVEGDDEDTSTELRRARLNEMLMTWAASAS